MKYFRKSLSLLFIFASFTIKAQTASDILDKYFSAIGGLSKLISVENSVYEGTSILDETIQTIKITAGEALWRRDIIVNGRKEFTLLTKNDGWIYNGNKLQRLDKTAKEKCEDAANIESSLTSYTRPGFEAFLMGKDLADGKICFKVRIKEARRQEAFVWFDTATFLKIQSAVTSIAGFKSGKKTNDVKVTVFTVFRHYKNVDGLLIPFTCLINAFDINTNKLVRKISTYFKKIEINKPIDPNLYKPE